MPVSSASSTPALQIGVAVEKIVGLPFVEFSAAPALPLWPSGDVPSAQVSTWAGYQPLRAWRQVIPVSTVVEKVEEAEDGVRVVNELWLSVTGRWAVVATNSPINDRVAIHTKQAAISDYAMSFEIDRGAVSGLGSTGTWKIRITMSACNPVRARADFLLEAARTTKRVRLTMLNGGSPL